MLRKSLAKDWNYIKKRLVNVNKGATFAPATATDVLRNTDKHMNFGKKNFFKKRFKKACEI